jgi:hypothetical protein
MNRLVSPRAAVWLAAFLLLGAALIAMSAVDPLAALNVEAQTQPTSISGEVAPPADTGTGSTMADPALAPPVDAPLADPEVISDAAHTGADGAYTTSLGGSDVAVSSVGGSYEVDGPKRRKDRLPGHLTRP